MKPETRNPNTDRPSTPGGPSNFELRASFGFRVSSFEFVTVTALLLALLTLAAYWPVRHHAFVAYDDPVYVAGNRHVQAGLTWAGVQWAFTTGHAGNWHPLTWLSHMLDRQFFGPGPAGPHLVNLAFHIANTLLLFALLRRLTGARWRSALVAALFALHPLHVESVAWVSERKDVLSAFFFMLTLLAYAKYVHSPLSTVLSPQSSAGHASRITHHGAAPRPNRQSAIGNRQFPFLALLLFALGLLCKPMLVTLPFVLLLLDYWPLNRVSGVRGQGSGDQETTNNEHRTTNAEREEFPVTHHAPRTTVKSPQSAFGNRQSAIPPPGFGWLLKEKLPFFALAAAASVLTFFVQQRGGAVESLARFSIGERLGNALVSYARYLGKTFWPADLAAPYPHPGHWSAAALVLAAALVAGLSLGAWRLRRRFPFALTGWLWFFGMLVPVIGLVQVGDQAMADRYTYLPLIGVFLVLAWGADAVAGRWRWTRWLIGAAAGLVVLAGAMRTAGQVRHWRDSESLFRHALAVTTGNSLAHNNLGNALLERKQADEAIAHFRESLRIKPDYADAHINLGNALVEKGREDEAAAEFQLALKLQPDSPEAHYNFGNLLLQKGRTDEALVHFRKVAEVAPDHVLARNNLANALLQKGQLDEAVIHYRAAVEFRPDFVVARHNLGTILLQKGLNEEAIAQFRQIVELQPGSANVHNNLGWALRRSGQLDEAVIQLERALAMQPDYPEAHGNLAKTLVLKGLAREAVAHYRSALKLQPDDAQYLSELAWLLATWPEEPVRNGSEAMALARQADQLASGKSPAALRALAAACAEAGRFEEAAAAARRALPLADAALAEALRSEIALYEAGAPVREGLKFETRPAAPKPGEGGKLKLE